MPFLVNDKQDGCNLHKFYPWQKDFYTYRGRLAFITAANQIGKSSILIIKVLNLAMRPELWDYYFRGHRPTLFMYLYPDQRTGKTEFFEKWTKEYLPKEELKDHPIWGWKEVWARDKSLEAINFASGVTLLFRYYSQKTTSMQAISLDFVGADEELPEMHWDEIMVRTTAKAGLGSGLVSTVFTATLGQPFLYDTMERQGDESERFPTAFKRQISLYDCLTYCDGTPSKIFTKERIETDIIPMYSSEAEILRRVWGRFVKDSGLVYAEFSQRQNTTDFNADDVEGWQMYCGIDFGSGGKTGGHPSSIVFVAVNKTYFLARVVTSWRTPKDGTGYERKTQADIIKQYQSLKAGLKCEPHTYYDWAATDLGTIALREGVPMMPANKNNDHGIGQVNSLFRSQQLLIFTGGGSGDNSHLIEELSLINTETAKKNRKDDMADGLRYALSSCPMRITKSVTKARPEKREKCARMRFYKGMDVPEDEKHLDWGEDIDQMLAEAEELFED